MKQISREKLTILDKLELAKKSTFKIKKIKFGYVYSVEAIFKDKNNEDKCIRLQFTKDCLEFAFPLLTYRSFKPRNVFPTIRMVTSLFLKDLFYYTQNQRPVWKSKFYINQYNQEILNTETTLNVFGHRLLSAIQQYVINEEAPH